MAQFHKKLGANIRHVVVIHAAMERQAKDL